MAYARARETDARRSLPSVKKAAYDTFQQALLQGKLRPGQVLSQKDLVVLLDLSIGALRELLPRLEAEGLLHVMPQRGIQITVSGAGGGQEHARSSATRAARPSCGHCRTSQGWTERGPA